MDVVNGNLDAVNGNLGPANGNLGAMKKHLFACIIPPGNFEMLSCLNKLDICSFKKNPHKSNLLRPESISKLPGGLVLYVNC